MEAGIHELTAGYALDALEPAERDAFERHLPGCEQCQEELASFWEVTSALASAADGPAPSPALRERILADAAAEKQTVVPLESRRRLSPAFASVTAIAAAAALGLGIYSVSLNGTLDDTRAALSLQRGLTSVLADPSAETVALAAGDGSVLVANGGDAVLVLDRIEPLPAGKTLQSWVIGADQKPLSAGTFQPTGSHAVFRLERQVPAGGVVAVTIENDGGATTPTQPPIAASKPI